MNLKSVELPATETLDKTIEVINQLNLPHPQICYVPEVDPIQTCDTCIVEADGKLVRSCSTTIQENMNIFLSSPHAKKSQKEAMDRILENHMVELAFALYVFSSMLIVTDCSLIFLTSYLTKNPP